MKGNCRHRKLPRRYRRIAKELRRRGGPKQGHSWAAKQAARRARTHFRRGSVAGSTYWKG